MRIKLVRASVVRSYSTVQRRRVELMVDGSSELLLLLLPINSLAPVDVTFMDECWSRGE